MRQLIEPFLKWAGGKRWLLRQYRSFLPKSFRKYYEPFLGSGSVFFSLLPQQAVLSDTNKELINAFQCIKKSPVQVHIKLKHFHKLHNKNFYYMMRMKNPDGPMECAARFIYLNRTCFNGLYRVNKQGWFNVPMGTKNLVEFPEGYLETVSNALQHADLEVSDFETVIDQTVKDDFVYIDPPYSVMHNTNNFIKYNSILFSWEDQVRLLAAIKRASSRGVQIMLSNADHESIRLLYRDFGEHFHLQRTSILAAATKHRRQTTELLIINY